MTRILGWFWLLLAAPVWAQAFAAGFRPSMTPELAARLQRADLAAGERFFERKCSQCHDGEKTGGHAKGPFLWNWYGRKAGTVAGFVFSPAMQKAGIVWDYATLDHYLADTERAVPGRAMDFIGIADADLRASLIAWLRRLNDEPPPLPE
ncbi:MAG: c-type cytochrome [Rhodocyclaceae bacterium]|nr:c-type cytochrome [Rhodocyclaceae bacterium]